MSDRIPFQALAEEGAEETRDRPSSVPLGERRRSSKPNAGTPLRDEALAAKERAEGLRSIVMGFGIFSAGITIALVVQLAVGEPQLAPHGAVSSTSQLCSSMGRTQLQKGANAVDAAITTMLCMGVTHPQYAGIGGGGLMIIHSHKQHKTNLFDFREAAPKALPIDSLFDEMQTEASPDGVPLRTLVRGNAIGVPGELRGMRAAWERFGSMSWWNIFKPVIALARDGFTYTDTFHRDLMRRDRHRLAMEHLDFGDDEETAETTLANFDAEIKPKKGHEGFITRPKLADTLEKVARNGPDAFYKGEVARDILAAVRRTGGFMTQADLDSYKVVERVALRATVGNFTVETFPAPASGSILLRLLKELLNEKTVRGWGPKDYLVPDFYATFAKLQTLTFACRAKLGDPAHQDSGLNMSEVEQAIFASDAAGKMAPLAEVCPSPAGGDGPERRGTAHISVVDEDELMVSVSTSMNWWFGSLVVATDSGVLLNSHMGDFDWAATAGPNAPAPLKRPLSGMVPSIFYRRDRPCLQRFAIGGVNGTKIPAGVAQVAANVMLFEASAGRALAAPRVFCNTQLCQLQNHPDELPKPLEDYAKEMEKRTGLAVEVLDKTETDTRSNQQCNVVALAGRSANATIVAVTDHYLDWGASKY